MFWGLTPALNFYAELPNEEQLVDVQELNILLVGGADSRHVLKTLAKRYQHHKDVRLNFYIMELVPEVYAKQILLLNLALQPIRTIGLAQKTRMFMEIYGNMVIRPTVARYLTQKAESLIEMITNLDRMKTSMPMVNIELKYKERDYIENVFKFWVSSDKFDVLESWDRRLRKSLGVRYDTRNAAFDWDLHMNLHNAGASYINTQEYQSFRRHGVAFAWLETEVARTNRSMVTGVIPNGDHFAHYGYLGDMQTGPFIAYGLECADEEFTKKSNNVYKYRSTDIAERNLREIFHELEFQTEYIHQHTSSITLGSTVMQIPDVKLVETGNRRDKKGMFADECIGLPGVTINFVSMKNLAAWKHKAQYQDFFNVIYFAHLYSVKSIDKEVVRHVSGDKCALIVENPRFCVNYREQELEKHRQQVETMLDGVDKCQCPFDIKKDSYIKYILQ